MFARDNEGLHSGPARQVGPSGVMRMELKNTLKFDWRNRRGIRGKRKL